MECCGHIAIMDTNVTFWKTYHEVFFVNIFFSIINTVNISVVDLLQEWSHIPIHC